MSPIWPERIVPSESCRYGKSCRGPDPPCISVLEELEAVAFHEGLPWPALISILDRTARLAEVASPLIGRVISTATRNG